MNEKKNYVLKAETGYIESKLKDEPNEADQVNVRSLYWLIDDLQDKLAKAQTRANELNNAIKEKDAEIDRLSGMIYRNMWEV